MPNAEYQKYHSSARKRRERSNRNKARRLLAKTRGKAAIAGKHVDHIDGNPNNNSLSNLRLMSPKANRKKQ